MTAAPDWPDEVFPGYVTGQYLDMSAVDRLAELLDADRLDVLIGLRSILRAEGHDVPPFEIRTNTWRIDLPTAAIRSVLGSVLAATVIEATGAPILPTALLSVVAPLLFTVRRVEVEAADVTVHAELLAVVGDRVHDVRTLYERLPAHVRAELSFDQFAEVVSRLLDARLASTGPDGVRLRSPSRRRGFQLALTPPSLLPDLVRVAALSPVRSAEVLGSAGPEAGSGAGPRLADGYPRVFISYAQESEDHKRAVHLFAECLHASGVGVVLDQDAPPHRNDWQQWATGHILGTDYVLVIGSPMCRQVGDGSIDPKRHLGLQAEMRTLRDLYASNHQQWLRRILPVVLPGMSVDDIPLFLQPHNADHYKVATVDQDGVRNLMRTLTAP